MKNLWLAFSGLCIGMVISTGCSVPDTGQLPGMMPPRIDGSMMAPPPDGGMMPPPDGGMMPPPDGGMMPPRDGGMMPPPDGGMMMPKSCTVDTDCVGACPMGAKGCKCATSPMGKVCAATCTTDADCPMPPMGSLMCDPMQGVCVPKRMM